MFVRLVFEAQVARCWVQMILQVDVHRSPPDDLCETFMRFGVEGRYLSKFYARGFGSG